MRVRVRVTASGSGFCGFCGSVSQVVDIAYFSRFWSCGSLVVFARGFVVLWIACGFWIARSALRVRNWKSRQNPRVGASSQVKCVSRARSALRTRRLELRPRKTQKPQRPYDVVFVGFVVFGRACGFCRLCGFWASLWFFAVFVVFVGFVAFGRACGSPFSCRGKGQTA